MCGFEAYGICDPLEHIVPAKFKDAHRHPRRAENMAEQAGLGGL
jgi:hypothetical protein